MTKGKQASGKKPGRASSTRRRSSTHPPTPRQMTLDEWLLPWVASHWIEIVGAGLVILSAYSLVALANLPIGALAISWRRLLYQIFGWGAWPVSLMLAFAGAHLVLRSASKPWNVTLIQVIGLELAFVASLALTHVGAAPDLDASLSLAAAGGGGGYVGWALAMPLSEGLGDLLAWILLAAIWLLGALLMLSIPRQDIHQWLIRISTLLTEWAGRMDRPARRSGDRPPATSAQDNKPEKRSKPSDPTPSGRRSQESVATAEQDLIIARPMDTKPRTHRRPQHLPPLDLLEQGTQLAQDEQEIRERAAIIEKTLLDFGLPVQVVEVRRGPAVTQFGVAPQYIAKPGANGEVREQKVRVSQITALSSDLALALAAKSIRIEAPVPGRSIVGIEVPNQNTAIVQLRPVLQSSRFLRLKSPLAIALGLDVSGTPVAADLGQMPHLLIAGTTGSGKSVAINAITSSLVINNRPDDLRLVMIDPKMVELVRFNGIPHLLGKVEVDLDRIIGVLRWLAHEMDSRYKLLAGVGVRNLKDYDALARRRKSIDRLPIIVLLIDELSDLMMMAPDEVEQTLVRLAQMARAVGIHLVIATQRPSTDVVTGLIKANFPARIAFSVASSVDSRVILDSVGAETLLGRGDMLYQAPEAPKPIRLQGCFVSDTEIERIVSFWVESEKKSDVELQVEAPWETFLARQTAIDDKDSLLEDAIHLVQGLDQVSASLLQRRLRVGYPRAARIMDALYQMGAVGPEQPGGRTRQVLISEDDDPLDDYVKDSAGG